MTAPGPDWLEQARRFAAGLADGLAAEHPGLTDALGGLFGATRPDPSAEHGSECRSCPLCAGLGALRGRRPDLMEALADVLTSAATTLRSAATAPDRTAHHRTPPDRTPSDRTTPDGTPFDRTTPDGSAAAAGDPDPTAPPEETVPAPTPTVQRIDVA